MKIWGETLPVKCGVALLAVLQLMLVWLNIAGGPSWKISWWVVLIPSYVGGACMAVVWIGSGLFLRSLRR